MPRALIIGGWTAVGVMAVGLGLVLLFSRVVEGSSVCGQLFLFESALAFVALGPTLGAIIMLRSWDHLAGRAKVIACGFGVAAVVVLFSVAGLVHSTVSKC